ncbi:unnamed protein product, partial [Mesorhabditis spiculigera]
MILCMIVCAPLHSATGLTVSITGRRTVETILEPFSTFALSTSSSLTLSSICLSLLLWKTFPFFYSSEEDALLSYADIRNFQQVWNIVDTEQSGRSLSEDANFQVDPNKDRLLLGICALRWKRLHNGDDISFHDVLNMLSYRSVDIRKSLQLEELVQREELEYIIEEEVAKQTIRHWLEHCLRKLKHKPE